MAKCKHCKTKLDKPIRYFSRGIYSYCSSDCFYKSVGKELKIVDKEDYVEPSEARFQPNASSEMALSEGTEQKTIKPDRDKKYLSYIRGNKCLACRKMGEGIHAHHTETGGMGTKGSDFSAIPLCSPHHTSGQEAIHNIGKEKFYNKFNIDIDKTIIKLLIGYINEQKS